MAKWIILAMGTFYIILGSAIGAVFFFVDGFGIGTLIPGIFVLIGLVMDITILVMAIRKKMLRVKGHRYSGKIYGYVDNTSFTLNGAYTLNTKVHYFDSTGVEREAIIPTSFPRGSNQYPIGMTIDIIEYHGKYEYDPKSVRNERLSREDELMDNKPIDMNSVETMAVTCPNCSASFHAAIGYANNCPYCGSAINAKKI